MNENFTDTLGVLKLSKPTAFIKALFGTYISNEPTNKLDQIVIDYSGPYKIRLWKDVAEDMLSFAKQLDLTVENSQVDPLGASLKAIAAKIGCSDQKRLEEILPSLELQSYAELEVLFFIATMINDGHELKCMKTETAFTSNKRTPFMFGGSGEYFGPYYRKLISTCLVHTLAENINSLLEAGDVHKVSEILAEEFQMAIDGIQNEDQKRAVNKIIFGDQVIDEVQENSNVRYYIGTLLQRRGEKERRLTVRFMTDGCPNSYLDKVASRYLSDDGEPVEKEDDGYYFDCGEIYLKPHAIKEVPKQFYLDCAQYNAVAFVSI